MNAVVRKPGARSGHRSISRPLALVVADEGLRVQAVRLERRRGAMSAGKSNSSGSAAAVRNRSPGGSVVGGRGAGAPGQHEAPLAERRHVHVVRRHGQTRLFDGRDDAPVGLAREQRRRGLHDERAVRREVLHQHPVERRACRACRARSSTGPGSRRWRSRTTRGSASSHDERVRVDDAHPRVGRAPAD